MRLLVVTGASRVTPEWARRLQRVLDLDADLTVVSVVAATAPLPVGRHVVVDPSTLPYRPLADHLVLDGRPPRGLRRQLVRALRLGRRALHRIGRETTAPSPRAALASAARTSRLLARLAADSDVVVASEQNAALAVWHLSRRSPGPLFVHRNDAVRPALVRHGHDLATTRSTPLAFDGPAPTVPPIAPVRRRLLIGPANYAGQARAWAGAVDRLVPDAAAHNFKDTVLSNPYPADLVVAFPRHASDLAWQLRWRRHVMDTYTHAIIEAGRALLGASEAGTAADVADLQDAGLAVALLSHGSDARIPSVHAADDRWAAYASMDPVRVDQLERVARRNVAQYRAFDGPVFLSTPGLLRFVPEGTWLPLVVDPDAWTNDTPALTRSRLVVAHAPSTAQKGSHHIDPVLEHLATEGVIEYRRVQGIPHDRMRDLYAGADVVVDQFGAADYGVAALEAMSAGRLVVSHVSERVRTHVQDSTGLTLPVVQADPETLESVIRDIVRDRDPYLPLLDAGDHLVRTVHDGRSAAQVLATWLDVSPGGAVRSEGGTGG